MQRNVFRIIMLGVGASLASSHAGQPQRSAQDIVADLKKGDDPLDSLRTRSFQVVHLYPMAAGKRYTIDLTSTWNNDMRVANPQGNTVHALGDHGGSPKNRIIIAVEQTGWYRITVTSYTGGVTGPYTLTVR